MLVEYTTLYKGKALPIAQVISTLKEISIILRSSHKLEVAF